VKYLRLFRNKFLVASVAFLVWILFFDHNNAFVQYQYTRELKELKGKKEYYRQEIERTRKELDQLNADPKAIEKVAREQYLMKKDDEEIFIVKEK
jgi:cell division protein FtsB